MIFKRIANYECLQHAIKHSYFTFLVRIKKFDDVTSPNELKYLLCFSFERYSKFLKSSLMGWELELESSKRLKGSTETSMLCTKSTTCSPQLPEYLTVRNSQKQKQTIAKAAILCTPFKVI